MAYVLRLYNFGKINSTFVINNILHKINLEKMFQELSEGRVSLVCPLWDPMMKSI